MGCVLLQGLDKELEQALANLESEQNAALDNVESMVSPCVRGSPPSG